MAVPLPPCAGFLIAHLHSTRSGSIASARPHRKSSLKLSSIKRAALRIRGDVRLKQAVCSRTLRCFDAQCDVGCESLTQVAHFLIATPSGKPRHSEVDSDPSRIRFDICLLYLNISYIRVLLLFVSTVLSGVETPATRFDPVDAVQRTRWVNSQTFRFQATNL